MPFLIALALWSAAPRPLNTARLLFAGDVTLGYHYEEYVDELKSKDAGHDDALGWGFARVGSLTRAADLFVVNLECPFTLRGEKLPKNFNFRARPELVAALEAGGVDVVSLANNHMVDYGPDGLTDTLATLAQSHIAAFGAGSTLSEARRPKVVKVNGIRMAFLGYFFLGDRNIEPAQVMATERSPGVAGHFNDLAAMAAMVRTDVRAAKGLADVVVPFFHWGREGQARPEPYQIELAKAAIDQGAAAVVGSHPHVLQGIVRYKGAPIAFSLGNFVFGGNWDPKNKRTALLELTVDSKRVVDARVIPAFSDAYPVSPVQPYLATGTEAARALFELAAISVGIDADFDAFFESPAKADAGRTEAR